MPYYPTTPYAKAIRYKAPTVAPPPPPPPTPKPGWFQLNRDHTFPSSDPESDGPTVGNIKWSVT